MWLNLDIGLLKGSLHSAVFSCFLYYINLQDKQNLLKVEYFTLYFSMVTLYKRKTPNL